MGLSAGGVGAYLWYPFALVETWAYPLGATVHTR